MRNYLKKLFTVGLLSVSLCSLFTGCGEQANNNEHKSLNVITHANWKPFEYIDKGTAVGFDIDLINAVAEEAGYKINVKDVGWEFIFQQIKDKSADVAISGITATNERKETFSFTVPYFISKEAMLVPADSEITSINDLISEDKTVSVQNGSTAQIAVEKVLGANNPNIKKTALSDQMLLNGQVDALVGDDTSLNEIISNHPDKNLKIIYDDNAFEPEYFSIMLAKDGNEQLQKDLNEGLKKVIDSGKYAEIYKKWFNREPNVDELKKLMN